MDVSQIPWMLETIGKNQSLADDYNLAMNSQVGGASPQYSALLWGRVIPITYGTRKVMGQVIQLGRRKQEIETIFNNNTPSASELQFATVTTDARTTFKATFAVAFGFPGNKESNQILSKLWVDKQLVYDMTQSSLSNVVNFRFYKGSEDQLPDEALNELFDFPLAYRGMMYAVIYDYTSSNHAVATMFTASMNPVIEAEIIEELNNDQTVIDYDMLDGPGDFANESTMLDRRNGIVYSIDNSNIIHKFDVREKVEIDNYPITFTGVAQPLSQQWRGFPQGFARVNGINYIVGQCQATNSSTVYLIEADTGNVIAGAGVTSGSLLQNLTHVSFLLSYSVTEYGDAALFDCMSIFGGYYQIKVIAGVISIVKCLASGTFTDLERVEAGGSNVFLGDGVNVDLLLPSGERVDDWYTMPFKIKHSMYCPNDDTVVFWAADDADLFDWVIRKVHMTTKETIWNRQAEDYPAIQIPGANSEQWRNRSFTNDNRVIAWAQGTKIGVLNTLAGSIEIYEKDNTFQPHGIFDAYTNRFIGFDADGNLTDFPIIDPSHVDMPLSALLINLAERQGYDPADIEVENIDDEIIGAAITEQSDIVKMLDNIRQAYNFSIIKRGKKIRFSKRVLGGSFTVDATITEANRAILSEDDDAFVTVQSRRKATQKVPGKITIRYIDPDTEYLQNTITHTRNDAYADAGSTLELTLPVIITGADAITLAARVSVDQVEGAMEHEFLLSQKYSYLEQGDYVRLTFSEYEDVVRIDRIDYNGDRSIKVLSTVVNFAAEPIYTLEELPPFVPPPSLLEGPSSVLMFDTPLLTYQDDGAPDRMQQWLGVIPAGRTSVTTASVIKINESGVRQVVGITPQVLTYGKLRDEFTGWPWQIDYEASISFRLGQGDPDVFQTVTVLEMLAGANRVLIGMQGRWELVGYIEASYDTGTKLVTLTGLLRGLRGTDVNVDNHQVGDYIVYVDAALLKEDIGVDLLNDPFLYLTQGPAGENFEEGVPAIVMGNALKPWAPSHVHAEDNAGDVDITWSRRTRLNGPLLDLTPDVPLDEASEEYELDIYRAGSIVRTVTALTTPAYTYTNADQVTDGWSGDIVTIQLDIYQISADVGRGFAKSGTFDVE